MVEVLDSIYPPSTFVDFKAVVSDCDLSAEPGHVRLQFSRINGRPHRLVEAILARAGAFDIPIEKLELADSAVEEGTHLRFRGLQSADDGLRITNIDVLEPRT